MGEFAAALAHEINQPLTAIANYTRLARDAVSPGAAAEAAGKAMLQVERAAEVVRRLRDLIRLGRSDTESISVASLVDTAVAYCRTELERHDVLIEARIPRDLPFVRVDALQIEQVLVNLVRNAVEALTDAGRTDGKVIIAAESDGAAVVVIRVRDNGPGFDPGLAERAHAPFTTTKPEGLGLGLSLARSIVEAHAGRLWIDSNPSGAVVSFTVPAAGAEQRSAA
jgi:C4-dicarboxylate-specific signal transduction histidine kinase